MKRVCVIILLILSIVSNAQSDELMGKVFLRNGKVHTEGFYSKPSREPNKPIQIIYKTKDSLQFIDDSKGIDKVRVFELDSVGTVKDSMDYHYKYHKNGFKLLQKIPVTGKFELYEEKLYEKSSMPLPIGPISIVMQKENKEGKYDILYYISKRYTTKIEYLVKDNVRFKKKKEYKRSRSPKVLKKGLKKYYAKCTAFIEKENDKEYFKTTSVKEIIQYFNDNCN